MSRTQAGHVLAPGELIQSAGEAAVYSVRGRHVLVFKKYHQPTQARLEKLEVMVAAPPSDPTWEKRSHRSIAWPQEVVVDDHGAFEGYVMPRIVGAKSLSAVYHPQDRRALGWEWTWRHLLRVAQNTASAIDALHRHRYVVGDINTENILVKPDTLITVIDCDSTQIPGPAGQLYRCPMGTQDFTAPEITAQLGGRGFEAVDRTEESDAFALAILIHLLLMEGTHPYAGTWQAAGDPPDRAVRMREGLYAFGSDSRVTPPKGAPSFDLLPTSLQDLFMRAFVTGASQPSDRPRADEWRRVLAALDKQLVACSKKSHHIYPSHLTTCPWCARVRKLGVADPFPEKAARRAVTPPPRPQPRNQPVVAHTRPTVPHNAPLPPAPAPRTRRRAAKIASAIAAVLVLATMGRLTQAASTYVPPAEAAAAAPAPEPTKVQPPVTTTPVVESTSTTQAPPTTTMTAPEPAALAPDTIVFASEGDLFTIRADGSSPTRLVTPGRSIDPAVSPDRQRIAFASWGVDGPGWRVFVMNADGSGVRVISPYPTTEDYDPAWSPDGTRIAFTCSKRICITDAAGSNVTVVEYAEFSGGGGGFPFEGIWEPSWSPDGTQLVFVALNNDPTETNLYIANADGSGLRKVTNVEGFLGQPAWSPHGEWIVFMRGAMGPHPTDDVYVPMNIWRIRADGTGLEQLTDVHLRNMAPAWSADGASIVFVSDRDGGPQLHVMKADGTEERVISDVEGRDPDWTR